MVVVGGSRHIWLGVDTDRRLIPGLTVNLGVPYDIIYRCKIEVVLTAPETRYFTFSG